MNPESLFLNFTVFLGFICVKDGELILFVEFSGHGPFLCGFFFRSPVKVDVRAEALGGGWWQNVPGGSLRNTCRCQVLKKKNSAVNTCQVLKWGQCSFFTINNLIKNFNILIWMTAAVDRSRFERRIQETGYLIEPILKRRLKLYNYLFWMIFLLL